METGKAIYKLLKDSSTVGAICADRIYPELAQQDADAPFVVYTVVDTTPSDTKTSTSKVDTARVELYCVGDNYESIMDLGIAVRGALDRQSGTISGVQVQSVNFDTSDIQFDPDQRVYVLEHTYNVRIQRTGTANVLTTFPGNTWTIEEIDGTPTGAVNKVLVSNGSLTIDGNTATLNTGGGVTSVNALTGIVELYGTNLNVQSGNPQTIYGKFTSIDNDLTNILDILKGSAGNELGIFSDVDDNTKPSLNVGTTNAILRGGTGTLIKAEQTSPGTLTFAVAAGANDTETTAMIISGQANGNVVISFVYEARFTSDVNFTGASSTVSFSGSTSGIEYSDLTGLPTIPSVLSDLSNVASTTPTDGQALVFDTTNGWQPEDISAGGVNYHDRYATEAETQRAGATANVELYYTARPDGDGLAESATSDSGVTDTINRTLFYATKFDADPDTAGDWTEYTTQPADNATFATAKAAILAGLSETDATAETRGTLPLSLKMVRTTTAPAGDLLLDDYPGAAAAYSVRKLDKDYTGSCMRVREDSGDTETDIGFDGNGDVDTAAIATHCGSADGFVVTWYDQSGNSNNATQSTTSQQPQIYNGTAVFTENGKNCIKFQQAGGSSAIHLDLTTSQSINTMFSVATAGANTNYNYITWNNSSVVGFFHGASTDRDLGFYDGNTYHLNGNDNTQALGYFRLNSTNYDLARDGGSVTLLGGGAGAISMEMIARDNGSNQVAFMQELIIYGSDESSNRTGIETNINTHFDIYT